MFLGQSYRQNVADTVCERDHSPTGQGGDEESQFSTCFELLPPYPLWLTKGVRSKSTPPPQALASVSTSILAKSVGEIACLRNVVLKNVVTRMHWGRFFSTFEVSCNLEVNRRCFELKRSRLYLKTSLLVPLLLSCFIWHKLLWTAAETDDLIFHFSEFLKKHSWGREQFGSGLKVMM